MSILSFCSCDDSQVCACGFSPISLTSSVLIISIRKGIASASEDVAHTSTVHTHMRCRLVLAANETVSQACMALNLPTLAHSSLECTLKIVYLSLTHNLFIGELCGCGQRYPHQCAPSVLKSCSSLCALILNACNTEKVGILCKMESSPDSLNLLILCTTEQYFMKL